MPHLGDSWGVKYPFSLLNPPKSLPKVTRDGGDRAAAGENRIMGHQVHPSAGHQGDRAGWLHREGPWAERLR